MGSGLFFIVIAFIAGIGVMGWALTQWDAARIWLIGEPEARAPGPALPPVQPALPAIGSSASSDPQIAVRLAAIEARMALLEASGIEGGGTSSRAEALVAVFSARRAIDRGVGLGALEALVTQQFGSRNPREVATILAAARQPVTLDKLRRDLDVITIAGATPGGWWDSFTSGLSELITVRSSETPQADPAARLGRAKAALAANDVEAARLEISQLPFDETARAWLLNAQRYRDAQAALDRIEAVALTPDTPPPAPPVRTPQAPMAAPGSAITPG